MEWGTLQRCTLCIDSNFVVSQLLSLICFSVHSIGIDGTIEFDQQQKQRLWFRDFGLPHIAHKRLTMPSILLNFANAVENDFVFVRIFDAQKNVNCLLWVEWEKYTRQESKTLVSPDRSDPWRQWWSGGNNVRVPFGAHSPSLRHHHHCAPHRRMNERTVRLYSIYSITLCSEKNIPLLHVQLNASLLLALMLPQRALFFWPRAPSNHSVWLFGVKFENGADYIYIFSFFVDAAFKLLSTFFHSRSPQRRLSLFSICRFRGLASPDNAFELDAAVAAIVACWCEEATFFFRILPTKWKFVRCLRVSCSQQQKKKKNEMNGRQSREKRKFVNSDRLLCLLIPIFFMLALANGNNYYYCAHKCWWGEKEYKKVSDFRQRWIFID